MTCDDISHNDDSTTMKQPPHWLQHWGRQQLGQGGGTGSSDELVH
jgi:hypothetical protein